MTVSGQFSCPSPGSFVAVSGQFLVSAVNPVGWVLRGSRNGKGWTTLNRREGERFEWRQYTRPFSATAPGRYTMFRLEFEGRAGQQTTVSEIELFG